MSTKVITGFAITMLIAATVFGVGFFVKQRQLIAFESQAQNNAKIVKFLDLFIEKVLEAKRDISFEDRLKLENEVRSLNDEQIVGQWNKFVNSQSIEDAQLQVKALLRLLVEKISY